MGALMSHSAVSDSTCLRADLLRRGSSFGGVSSAKSPGRSAYPLVYACLLRSQIKEDLYMERKELTNNILELEWDMFTNVTNVGGRAPCQDDRPTFMIMRKAQADIWSMDTLISYLLDLKHAVENKINLMAVKYAHMMKITFPEEYEKTKNELPPVSPRVGELAREIIEYHSKWALEASVKYPKLFSLGRPITVADREGGHYASIDNYLHSELLTYSEATLEHCLKDTQQAGAEGRNLSLEILKNTAESYGFESLDAMEKALSKVR
jgi:hypothetical protein